MANILDYIYWRGDLTFEERSFNEVDNLIFSELAYLKMDGILTNIGDIRTAEQAQPLLEEPGLNTETIQAAEAVQAAEMIRATEAIQGTETVKDKVDVQAAEAVQDTEAVRDAEQVQAADAGYELMAVQDMDAVQDAERDILTVADIVSRYEKLGYRQSELPNDPKDAALAMAKAPRYKDLLVSDYINIIDDEKEIQFAAMTIHAPEFLYIAFRGTDNTIVGWREDFNFSYQRETPAQGQAVTYMNYILQKYRAGIYLADRYRGPQQSDKTVSPAWMPEVYAGGHSKGGNLAIYAAAFCDPALQPLLTSVYSFDGPGFNRYVTQTGAYQAILPKVTLTIPESSLIGILMSNADAKKIVKCSAEGSNQHNPYTWLIERDRFEEAKARSESSVFLDGTINKWLDRLDDKTKEGFVNTVFDVIDATGAGTFAGIMEHKWESYNAILNAVRALPTEDQKLVLRAVKELAVISGDALWNEAKKTFEENQRNRQ